jgi:hypothetical protein
LRHWLSTALLVFEECCSTLGFRKTPKYLPDSYPRLFLSMIRGETYQVAQLIWTALTPRDVFLDIAPLLNIWTCGFSIETKRKRPQAVLYKNNSERIKVTDHFVIGLLSKYATQYWQIGNLPSKSAFPTIQYCPLFLIAPLWRSGAIMPSGCSGLLATKAKYSDTSLI